jgi:hypothetical protein
MKTIVGGSTAALLCLALTGIAEAQRGGSRGSLGPSAGRPGGGGSFGRSSDRGRTSGPTFDRRVRDANRAFDRGRAIRDSRTNSWGRNTGRSGSFGPSASGRDPEIPLRRSSAFGRAIAEASRNIDRKRAERNPRAWGRRPTPDYERSYRSDDYGSFRHNKGRNNARRAR